MIYRVAASAAPGATTSGRTWPSSPRRRSTIWLTGTFRYTNTYPTAIALAASGRVDLEAIITGCYSLEETERALRAGLEDPANVKGVVHP